MLTKPHHTRLNMRLSDRLIQERKRRGWTLKKAADELQVGFVTLFRWEKGETWPRADALAKIRQVYGFTLADLESEPERVWMIPFLRNQYFTGRERILKGLRQALMEKNAVAVISQKRRTNDARSRALSGLGGMGKTQTAVEYAYRYERDYQVVLWAVADSHKALLAAFAEFARRLGLSGQGVSEETNEERLAQRVKIHLESKEARNWLLIVDNAEDLTLLKSYLPTRSLRNNGATLVTTRQRAVGKQMTRIDLESLSQEEGVSFLLQRVSAARGALRDTLPESERQAAEELCALLGGLPLALDQAAAYVEEDECSLAAYLARYRERRSELLDTGNAVDANEHPDSVATTILLSLQRIEVAHPAAAELLRLCAYCAPDAIPAEIFAAGAESLGPVLGPIAASPSELRRAIEALTAYSLVKWQASANMLQIHRLVQVMLQEAQTDEEQRLWAQRALLAVNAAYPVDLLPAKAQRERLSMQAFHVTSVIQRYELYSSEAGRLLFRLGEYLQTVGAAKYGGDPALFHRQALRILRRAVGPNDARLSEPLSLLAMCYLDRGQYAQAERYGRLAVRIAEGGQDAEDLALAHALNNLGCVYEEAGKLTQAKDTYQRALAINRVRFGPINDQLGINTYNVACIYHKLGRYDEAETLYQQALEMWNQLLGENSLYAAFAFDRLGDLRREQERYAEAETFLLAALAIWGAMAEPLLGEGTPLHGLAKVYHTLGKYTEAETYYQRALVVRERQAKEHPLIASTLAGLALIACSRAQYERAEEHLQRAQRICARINDSHPAHIETLLGVAHLREGQERYAEARACCARALAAQKRSLGAQHPHTLATRQWLARLQSL